MFCFSRGCWIGWEQLDARQWEMMAKCHQWGDAEYPEHVSWGWSPVLSHCIAQQGGGVGRAAFNHRLFWLYVWAPRATLLLTPPFLVGKDTPETKGVVKKQTGTWTLERWGETSPLSWPAAGWCCGVVPLLSGLFPAHSVGNASLANVHRSGDAQGRAAGAAASFVLSARVKET